MNEREEEGRTGCVACGVGDAECPSEECSPRPSVWFFSFP